MRLTWPYLLFLFVATISLGCERSYSSEEKIYHLIDAFSEGVVHYNVDIYLDSVRIVTPDFLIEAEPSDGSDLYLSTPFGIDSRGKTVYASDPKMHHIAKLSKDGDMLDLFGKQGQAPGEFTQPEQIASNNNYFFIYDKGNRRVQIFEPDFTFVASIPALFSGQSTMAVNEDYLFLPADPFSEEDLIDIYSAAPPFEHLGSMHPKLALDTQEFQALNEIKIATDKEGSVFVSYSTLPIVFIYDSSLELEGILRLEAAFLKHMLNLSEGKIGFPIESITVDDSRIYIGSIYAQVFILNREGDNIELLDNVRLTISGEEDEMDDWVIPKFVETENSHIFVTSWNHPTRAFIASYDIYD